MTERRFYVYALKNPLSGEVFYIGKGCGKRHKEHHMGSKRNGDNPAKDHLIECLLRDYGKIDSEIIQSNLTEAEALLLEKQLITHYGRKIDGGCLVNMSLYGTRSRLKNSDLHRERIGNAHRGRKLSMAHKIALSKGHLGKPSGKKGMILSDETKDKLKKANIGKKLSIETRLKISLSVKQSWENIDIQNRRASGMNLAWQDASERRYIQSKRMKENNPMKKQYGGI